MTLEQIMKRLDFYDAKLIPDFLNKRVRCGKFLRRWNKWLNAFARKVHAIRGCSVYSYLDKDLNSIYVSHKLKWDYALSRDWTFSGRYSANYIAKSRKHSSELKSVKDIQ